MHSLVLAFLTGSPALAAPVSQATEIASRAGANVERPMWSSDGVQLAYEANFHDRMRIELFVGNANTGAFRRLQPMPGSTSDIAFGFGAGANAPGRAAHELAWNPAFPEQYVYSADSSSGNYDIYGQSGPIVSHPATDGDGAWAPDGASLVFSSSRTGEGDLYILNLARTSSPRRLTRVAGASELQAAWSPNGEWIAFIGRGASGEQLHRIPAAGGSPRVVATLPGTLTSPRISPDGSSIAFYASRPNGEGADLYTVQSDGRRPPIRVAEDVVVEPSGPSWFPNSTRLLFICNRDEAFDPICSVTTAPLSPVKTQGFGTQGHGDVELGVTPAGRVRVAITARGKMGSDNKAFRKLYIADWKD